MFNLQGGIVMSYPIKSKSPGRVGLSNLASSFAKSWVCLALAFSLACLGWPKAAISAESGCASVETARKLDFWLGEWSVTHAGSTRVATSRVVLSLDSCLVTENWDDREGHSGVSEFAYSDEEKKWHGFFADNKGRAHTLAGMTAVAKSVQLQGDSIGDSGQTVIDRVSIIQIAPDQVQQLWEKSADNGATWSVVYRGEYKRKPTLLK
jgi:hypothetical protein